MDADDAARVQRLREEGEVHFFDKIAAERLADEVAVLVCRGVIDARPPAGDALLDYRSPPPSDRSDRLVNLEAEVQSAERDIEALTAERDDALKLGRLVARALDDLCSHRAAHDWFERFGYTE
jgi:hypothetical protein